MGENFVNYQVKANSISNVVNVVQNLTKTQAYVSPHKNGWITIYDQSSEDFKYVKPHEMYDFAQKLSFELSTAVLAFIVISYFGYDFIYLLYDSGQIIDEFFGDPESFEFGFKYADKSVIEKFKGKPEKLIKYCPPERSIQSISYILDSCRDSNIDYMGVDAVWHLALLLGIDEYRATIGYKYFEKDVLQDEEPDIEEAKDFVLVSKTGITYLS